MQTMEFWKTISQYAIPILTISAILLVAKKNKWGFVVGLSAQPFWFIETISEQQWGVVLTAVACTISWIYGIYEWFFKGKNKETLLCPKSELELKYDDDNPCVKCAKEFYGK